MNLPLRSRLLYVVLLLCLALLTALFYTTLHEGGHALAGLAFGGRISDFNVNFFNLSAPHVGLDGSFDRAQEAVINISGAALPLLAWSLLMLLLPRRNSFALQWAKIIASMGTLNTLLAWIIVPFLYISGNAPAYDDVPKFIANSGFPALGVAAGALLFYAAGWGLFSWRIGNLREAFSLLRPADAASLPLWKRVAIGVILVAAMAGALAVVFASMPKDTTAPPKGYVLAATIPLTERSYQAESIAVFKLDQTADAAIFLRLENINTRFIDIALVSSASSPITLIHGEDFSTSLSASQAQYRLPAGQYQVALTSEKSAGVVKVYLRVP